MHHLKETIIDGVKFVLIPEELLERVIETLRGDPDFSFRAELALELESA